jgi:hypothetical protein
MLLKSKSELESDNIYGNYTIKPDQVTDIVLSAKQENSVGYIKKLHSGIFSNEDYMFPVHRVAGGLELELDIASKATVLRGATRGTTDNWNNASFEITNVKFVFSLLTVLDDFLSKYNSMSNNSELVLPITTFQRHISTFSSGEIEPVIFINSAKKEVRRAYSVFTKNITTVQDAPLAASGSGAAAVPIGTGIQYPRFLKGTSDTEQTCIRFLHRYQDRQFPENDVQATLGVGSSVTDQTNLLEHALTNIPLEKTKMSPYLASLSKLFGSGIRSIYEEEFMIVQDYYY